jgi:beta-lactam-binding protein with PASTA domain
MSILKNISIIQLFFAVCATLLIVFITALISDWVILPLYTKHGADLELPDLVERPVSQADSILSRYGLQLIIDRSEYHPVLPESTVVFQNPLPYTHVKRGRRIYVTISAGERYVMVPRIVGISERDAQFKIQQAGLTAGEIRYQVSTYPQNVVCAQDLPPNTEVTENTEISYTVSLGRSKSVYTVPDVVGREYREGITMIRREGLQIGTVKSEIKIDLIPETIINQQPPPGTVVNPGSPVHLIISKLPESPTQGDSSAFDSDIPVTPGG